MSVWGWVGIAVGIALAIYVAFVLALLMLGRRRLRECGRGLYLTA